MQSSTPADIWSSCWSCSRNENLNWGRSSMLHWYLLCILWFYFWNSCSQRWLLLNVYSAVLNWESAVILWKLLTNDCNAGPWYWRFVFHFLITGMVWKQCEAWLSRSWCTTLASVFACRYWRKTVNKEFHQTKKFSTRYTFWFCY